MYSRFYDGDSGQTRNDSCESFKMCHLLAQVFCVCDSVRILHSRFYDGDSGQTRNDSGESFKMCRLLAQVFCVCDSVRIARYQIKTSKISLYDSIDD